MSEDEQLRVWDAINAYAQACGGDTSATNTAGVRMNAVVAVENALLDLTQNRVLDATSAVERVRAEVIALWAHGARQARRLIDENNRLRAERDRLAANNARFRAAARASAKQHGVNIDDLRDWVTRREKLTIRDRSLKQGFEYAKTLLAVFEGVDQ